MKHTLEEVQGWSLDKRLGMYRNAKSKHSPEAIALVALLEKAGLPKSIAGLTADDPVTIRMVNIITSENGRKACIAAASRGVPAICGVDPMLAEELGPAYTKDDLGTATAGSIVAIVMREAGYTKRPNQPCEEGCVAKTGAMWAPKGKVVKTSESKHELSSDIISSC